MTLIVASEADRIAACGAAAIPPKVKIDISGPAAALGRAVHDCLEDWINDGCDGQPKPQPGANTHGANANEVADLIEKAPDAIAMVREDLSNLKAEVEIFDDLIRGRIDVLSLLYGKDQLFGVAIIDWKTGQSQESKIWQRVSYASAVESKFGMPAQGYIYTAEIWLATQEIVETRADIDLIKGFRERIKSQLKHKTASPGPHCKYCKRLHECDARAKHIRAAIVAINDVGDAELSPEHIASLWDKSRDLKAALQEYEKAVDATIDINGELDLGDGRKIVMGEKTRETIDARKAWPTMSGAGLTKDEINSILTVNKTKLLTTIGAKAVRGKKAQAKADLLDTLDQTGAITRNRTRYRRIITEDPRTTENPDANE